MKKMQWNLLVFVLVSGYEVRIIHVNHVNLDHMLSLRHIIINKGNKCRFAGLMPLVSAFKSVPVEKSNTLPRGRCTLKPHTWTWNSIVGFHFSKPFFLFYSLLCVIFSILLKELCMWESGVHRLAVSYTSPFAWFSFLFLALHRHLSRKLALSFSGTYHVIAWKFL